jgi:hypothetical protein
MSSKGISDPLYEGVSSRSLSDRALWTGQAAYDIYKIGPGKRKVLASDIVLGWIAERTPLRTNVQPTFNDLAYVKPEWSGAIEKTIGEYQGRVGGSTALSSELKNMPSEVKAGLEVELTRKAKDIDIRLKPGDALPFAESAVKNIKLADPTAKIWISKGENTSANVKAVINGDTVTVFDIKALEMNEGGSSGYGIGLKPYYNLAREPLTRQLYNKGELGYTGDIPSTTMSYLLQRKTLSAYVDNLFDSKKWGYRMDKDTADVIGPSMAMKAYWTSKASNPLALRSKLYSWLSDASIKNISEHKYTFFDD